MKVTIVGAGNVGATCADAIAYQGMASEVVLLDIKEGFAEGKALDMMQTATTLGFNTKITGTTSDYAKTANNDNNGVRGMGQYLIGNTFDNSCIDTNKFLPCHSRFTGNP